MKRLGVLLVTIVLLVAISVAVLMVNKKPDWLTTGPKTGDEKSQDWVIKQGLDLKGGVRLVLQAETDKLPKGQTWDPAKRLPVIIGIIRSRIDGFGVSEPVIQPKGRDQIVVELPDIDNKDKAISLLQGTARLELWHLPVQSDRRPNAKYELHYGKDSAGNEDITFSDAAGKEVKLADVLKDTAPSDLIVTGSDMLPTSEVVPSGARGVEVKIEFNSEGREKFADFTRKSRGEILAIILDNRVISAPVIQNPILDGNAVITGSFTVPEAEKLSRYLNAGSLPVPLTVVSKQVVEATLGQAAVGKSLHAGAVGLGAVALFMIIYYALPGLLADLALIIYTLLTLAAFKIIGVTMTLPGITALILSIGMAVDANVLIFERLKEELRSGKALRPAIDAGFGRAFTSILDSNVCTAITCLILMWVGSGSVKGFAVVLLLGVAISMFTAITVTRTFLYSIVNTGFAQDAKWFGLRRQWGSAHKMDVVSRMNLWFAISLAIIIPGAIFLGMGGLKKGIDFTGGEMLTVSYKQNMASAEISGALEQVGLPDSAIQRAQSDEDTNGTYTYVVRTSAQTADDSLKARQAIQAQGGTVVSEDMVGGTVSKELTRGAILAVIIASIAIVLYLTIRFAIGGLAFGLRFGTCAVIALLHDVLVILGVFAILGYFLNWQIDSLFVTALLTIIGFSVHDTIVIFDRIRENLRHRVKGESFDDLVNRSIVQSFGRSVNTSLTVVITLVALLALGAGGNIRQFVIALLVGIVSGTYSSIFNASQLLVLWQRAIDKKRGSGVSAGQRVRELKPLVDVPMAGVGTPPAASASQEGIESSDADGAPSVKAKSASGVKKRKRRF